MKFIIVCLLICFYGIFSQENKVWSAEEFLTGKFVNNLGSFCILKANNGLITGEYFTKPSHAKLVEKGFPVIGRYSAVKDGALISMNVVFEMEGENGDGLEMITHSVWNGKVYSSKNSFKLNWLLTQNQIENKEWTSTNIGQDVFTKV